ncbi:hypothetical protein [Streptomyces sp. SM12]|uniref:hypothetical protein n=1 Tax=Streptomyces sp. SM12 TaxID=1071602 RepID=UPI000CD54F2E|nr:hypothetical protein [Streptomyces sp. SM12]
MTAHLIGWEIACDGPAPHVECPASAALQPHPACAKTPAEVRAYGRATQGWITSRRHKQVIDLCPHCQAEPDNAT